MSSYLALAFFLLWTWTLTISMAKKKEEQVYSTADCIKKCTDVKDCTCPVLKDDIKKEYVLAFCEDQVCTYCVIKNSYCAFGFEKRNGVGKWGKYGFLACCDQVGKGEDKYKGEDIACRKSLLKGEYNRQRCYAPCDATPKETCTDKDGYVFGFEFSFVDCSVNGNNKIWRQCQGKGKANAKICGATGAKCPDEVKACCKEAFKCVNNVCVRRCRSKGEHCVTKLDADNVCCEPYNVCHSNKCQA